MSTLSAAQRAALSATLQSVPRQWREARDQSWQFPKCIEVLPGHYEIAVSYLLRRTTDAHDKNATMHVESTEPSTVGNPTGR